MKRPNLLPSACLGLLALSCACSGTDHVVDPGFDFAAVTSYAWKEEPKFLSTDVADEALLRTLERRIERLLSDRGVPTVQKSAADVVLSSTLGVSKQLERKDRQYSSYASEEIEIGTLTLQIFDRQRRKLVWSAETSARLRVSGKAFGGLVQRIEPTDEPRVWPIEKMVEELVELLPADFGGR